MGNKKYEVERPPSVQHTGSYTMNDFEGGKEMQQGNPNQGVETVGIDFAREGSRVELRKSIGSCCLRRLQWIVGSPGAFTVCVMVFSMFSIASTAYYGSALATIERQFQLSSTESGAISIVNNALGMALILFVTYFGQRSHRPRIIGIGILLVGIGNVMHSIPHYLLDPYTNIPAGCNDTFVDYCADVKEDPCETEFEKLQVNPVWWLIIGQVLLGVGGVSIRPLSVTYIDDAVGAHTTPLYIAFLFVGASLGTLIGFFMASGTLGVFVDFDRVAVENRPPIDENDPRFIGAWWVGFIVFGCAIIASSVPLFFFPRYLPVTEERSQEEEAKRALANGDVGVHMEAVTGEDEATDDEIEVDDKKALVDEEVTKCKSILLTVLKVIKELVLRYKKMLMNGALLFLCLETAMTAAGLAGGANFLLKYVNLAFDATPAETSLMAVIVMPFSMVGTVIGSFIMRRRKWSPAKCALLIIFGEVVNIFGMPVSLVFSCKTLAVAGVSTSYVSAPTYDTLPVTSGPIILIDSVEQARSPCNLGCPCGTEDYNPVCGSDGLTYVSPCYAGCEVVESSKDDLNRTIHSFSDCRCISAGGVNATATDGECAADCKSYHIPVMLAIYAVAGFCSGLGQTGIVLITLRIVEEDMRASAIGIQDLLNNVFGFLTAPIYFGALFNNACLLWNYDGINRGACSVYDVKTTRLSYCGLTGSFRVVGFFMMLGVFFFLRAEEKNPKDENAGKNGEVIST